MCKYVDFSPLSEELYSKWPKAWWNKTVSWRTSVKLKPTDVKIGLGRGQNQAKKLVNTIHDLC
jgi:hypothetical protein